MKLARFALLAVAAITLSTGSDWYASASAEPRPEARGTSPNIAQPLTAGAKQERGKQFKDVAQPIAPTGSGRTYTYIDTAAPKAPLGNAESVILRKYSSTTDEAERTSLAASLHATVAKQFAARQVHRLKELQRLEEQLARLRSIHQRRDQERGRIVDARVQQLLRDADGLGWGSEGDSSNARKTDLPFRLPLEN